jgi:hypothetical protein
MTSQLLTIPLPASKAFLICPRAVVSASTSFPTKEYVLPSFRSRYLENMGVILNRGASSKDQPARVPDEPATEVSANVLLGSAQRGRFTIIDHNCSSISMARLRFLVSIRSRLDKLLKMCFSRRVQLWWRDIILWFSILHWCIDGRGRHF